jgi:hypothetical protein
MELVAANMNVMLTMNPAEYGCNMQGVPTAPQLAISRSDVVCLVRRIHCGVRPQESPNCETSMHVVRGKDCMLIFVSNNPRDKT